MSNTQSTEVRISGDSTGAVDALKKASDAVSRGFGDMQSAMKNVTGDFGKLTSVFGGFTTLLAGAGVTAINQMVQAFASSVEETRDLARSLGITTNEVAGLQAALDDVGSSTGEYETAAKGLQRQLRTNEKALKDMGLATRDSKNELRPMSELMVDSIALLNTYKAGVDRNVASQEMFGRGISGSSRLLLLNAETVKQNQEAVEELGLVVGANAVQAWEQYDTATDRAGLTLKALGRAVGETVMPAVTTLITAFNNAAPAAIFVLRGALSGLTTAFLALVNGVRLVWEVINAMVISVAEPIMALGRALLSITQGEFSQAVEEMKAIPNNIGDAWSRAYSNVLASSTDTAEKIKAIWSSTMGETGGTGASGSTAGTRTVKEKTDKPKKDKKETEESGLPGVDAALSAARLRYAQEHDLREMNKAEELTTYQELLAAAKLTEKDKITSARKVAEMTLAILREQRQQEITLSEESVEAYKQQQLAVVEAARQENQFLLDIGAKSAQQMLSTDRQLEEQRYAIVKEAVAARLAILEQDPTKNVVALQKLNNELAAVEEEHALRMQTSMRASQKEQRKDWQDLFDSIGSAFGNVVTGLVNRTLTLGQAVRSLFQGLLQSVASYLGQMVAKKVAAYAMEKALALGAVASNAAVAGSGAAAAVADVPMAGPALALAALAAVFAAVIGLQSSVPSARHGFDIPAGVNPLTQLHEREMVLPEEQADAVRNMAGGSAGERIIINATGGDFIHKSDLARLLKQMNRNYEFS